MLRKYLRCRGVRLRFEQHNLSSRILVMVGKADVRYRCRMRTNLVELELEIGNSELTVSYFFGDVTATCSFFSSTPDPTYAT